MYTYHIHIAGKIILKCKIVIYLIITCQGHSSTYQVEIER